SRRAVDAPPAGWGSAASGAAPPRGSWTLAVSGSCSGSLAVSGFFAGALSGSGVWSLSGPPPCGGLLQPLRRAQQLPGGMAVPGSGLLRRLLLLPVGEGGRGQAPGLGRWLLPVGLEGLPLLPQAAQGPGERLGPEGCPARPPWGGG